MLSSTIPPALHKEQCSISEPRLDQTVSRGTCTAPLPRSDIKVQIRWREYFGGPLGSKNIFDPTLLFFVIVDQWSYRFLYILRYFHCESLVDSLLDEK